VNINNSSKDSFVVWVFVLGFFAALIILVALRRIIILVFALYAVASIIAFVLYAWDKKAAEKNTWRVREDTLHWMALLGGWPGALYAQNHLRHKSKKLSFLWVFWLTVVLNLTLLCCFIAL
jgi:uncharacterized membrane protein YsdA (DUF1294 family)